MRIVQCVRVCVCVSLRVEMCCSEFMGCDLLLVKRALCEERSEEGRDLVS